MAQQTASGKSAGRPWWRVDEDGMRRHISGQVVECFSGGEVKAILGLVGDVVARWGWVPGGNLALVDFNSIDSIRRNPGPSTSGMSINSFVTGSTRIAAYLFGESSTKYKLFDFSLETPPDRIKISAGRDYSNRVVCLVVKSADDYFYVLRYQTASDYYICDGAVGLMSLLPSILQAGPARY